jgi:hypothetical protein
MVLMALISPIAVQIAVHVLKLIKWQMDVITDPVIITVPQNAVTVVFVTKTTVSALLHQVE